jgi:hypothetical protein
VNFSPKSDIFSLDSKLSKKISLVGPKFTIIWVGIKVAPNVIFEGPKSSILMKRIIFVSE